MIRFVFRLFRLFRLFRACLLRLGCALLREAEIPTTDIILQTPIPSAALRTLYHNEINGILFEVFNVFPLISGGKVAVKPWKRPEAV